MVPALTENAIAEGGGVIRKYEECSQKSAELERDNRILASENLQLKERLKVYEETDRRFKRDNR